MSSSLSREQKRFDLLVCLVDDNSAAHTLALLEDEGDHTMGMQHHCATFMYDCQAQQKAAGSLLQVLEARSHAPRSHSPDWGQAGKKIKNVLMLMGTVTACMSCCPHNDTLGII